MDRIRTRAMTAALLAALTLGLAACGGGKQEEAPPAPPATPEEAVQRARESLADISSVSYDLDLDMELTLLGMPVTARTEMEADCIVSPLRSRMEAVTDMGDMGKLNTALYVSREEEGLVLYSGLDAVGTGDLTWIRKTLDETETAETEGRYDVLHGLDLYLGGMTGLTEIGREQVDGWEAVRYDGTVPGEALGEIVRSAGLFDQLGKLGLDAGASLAQAGDMTVCVWLDAASWRPVRCDMDLTALMQGLLASFSSAPDGSPLAGEAEAELSAGKAACSLRVTGYNGVESIEIPAAALAAGGS